MNIAPYALPNTPANEIRFEDPRDIERIEVEFADKAPGNVGVSYLAKTWPETRIEERSQTGYPISFGWIHRDDWFNGEWREAAIDVAGNGPNKIAITFKPLQTEFPDFENYNVAFRRAVGFRIDVPDPASVKVIRAFTPSKPAETVLRVMLDAGGPTPTKNLRLSGYNAEIGAVDPISGVSVAPDGLLLAGNGLRAFAVPIRHMKLAHEYCNDDGLVTFALDEDTFTVSLVSLEKEGPVWYEHQHVFITRANDPTTFDEYLARIANDKTITQRVKEHEEQDYANAYCYQPRPHAVSYNVGCSHARQRFRIEANGDICLAARNTTWVKGKDTGRYKAKGDGRFFFGLEKWDIITRYPDPEPVLAYTVQARREGVTLEEHAFAVPLLVRADKERWAGDDPMVCMLRFRFRNDGAETATATLPIRYSQENGRSSYPLIVPQSSLDELTTSGKEIRGPWEDGTVLRAWLDTRMETAADPRGLILKRALKPGETCEAVIKIPFIALESKEELDALAGLDFDRCKRDTETFWHEAGRQGAQMSTPEPVLAALHKAHAAHVQITDFAMPDDPELINTSVGTSTYGNFTNESCMIVHELDERGLHEEARRRLAVWIKYQGTVPQPGNFTDYDGMFYGAGGFEQGSYNQHHAWVLWALAEHYFLTRDEAWLRSVADPLIKGADWVFRQRKNTMTDLPHSRGWERGFLPAGSLEDVTDFYYWLSTNALTWRGTEWTARALEAIGHPDAARVRQESDAYKADLIRGFETMREHSPVVRLRDGRWIPHYPCRLYRRGREVGWIRETLEGPVYLLITGLYDPKSPQAQWILDDVQDNKYTKPPYGYELPNFEKRWFSLAGISMQPNLLAGLMPHIVRDEPELYIWMFYNCWCACYREEINAMVEHPMPILGDSNNAHYKTSDQANAVSWLRYMFIFSINEPEEPTLLHLGRAIPRAWFDQPEPFELRGMATPFGPAGVRYEPDPEKNCVKATAFLDLTRDPSRVLCRFRLPDKKPITSVLVNGKEHTTFDPATGDVDLTGLRGTVAIEVQY